MCILIVVIIWTSYVKKVKQPLYSFLRTERLYGSRLNFSDEDLNWSFISSKFNLHLSFWSFFDLSSVV